LANISKYSRSLVDVGGYFKFLTDINGNLILVEFGGILRLVKSSGFLGHVADISENLSGFLRLWFRFKTMGYGTFLFTIQGGT